MGAAGTLLSTEVGMPSHVAGLWAAGAQLDAGPGGGAPEPPSTPPEPRRLGLPRSWTRLPSPARTDGWDENSSD